MEVCVSTPLEVCEGRDPEDLYQKARAGKIHGFTGIDDPYEPPLNPEVVCNTDRESTRERSIKVLHVASKCCEMAAGADLDLTTIATQNCGWFDRRHPGGTDRFGRRDGLAATVSLSPWRAPHPCGWL